MKHGKVYLPGFETLLKLRRDVDSGGI